MGFLTPVTASLSAELEPNATASRFALLGPVGVVGAAETWTMPDGTRRWRESVTLAGKESRAEQSVRAGRDGLPVDLSIVTRSGAGEVAESYQSSPEGYRWKGPFDEGRSAVPETAFYFASSGPSLAGAQLLIETLLARPDRTMALLPRGRAVAEKLVDLDLTNGGARRTVSLWAVSGVAVSPLPIWTTSDGKFFAAIDLPVAAPAGYQPAVIPAGDEALFGELRRAQVRALAARSATLARSFRRPRETTAFVNVRAFVDGRFLDRQTVVVAEGRIKQIGPADDVAPPPRSRIVDGVGKTLVPGLWDYHRHVEDDATGPFMLSLGITSLRDPSSDNAATLDRARRRERGDLLFPHIYASALIDGPGPNSTQTRPAWAHFGVVVKSRPEALAAVRDAKRQGFRAIKFYGSINPAWVGAMTGEAHRLGLRVHGHLPAGWRPSHAIDAGYDEITHAYFMIMEAMPDEVVSASQTRSRFEGPGRLAKDIDLAAGPMAPLLREMARRDIAADPTLVVVEWILTAAEGRVAPAYVAYQDTAPPMLQRRFRLGAIAREAPLEDRLQSFARLKAMVGAAHRAGVRIAAGTDSSGLELVRELEHYVAEGFSNVEALEAATIVPARLLGVDDNTGSIAIGKAADLLLVQGDPSKQIGDLRQTRMVMLGGRLLDADQLRAVSGFSGRPR